MALRGVRLNEERNLVKESVIAYFSRDERSPPGLGCGVRYFVLDWWP